MTLPREAAGLARRRRRRRPAGLHRRGQRGRGGARHHPPAAGRPRPPDLAVRWNCKAGKCGSCSAEINGRPRLMCMTRMSTFGRGRDRHGHAAADLPGDPRPGHRRVVQLREGPARSRRSRRRRICSPASTGWRRRTWSARRSSASASSASCARTSATSSATTRRTRRSSPGRAS